MTTFISPQTAINEIAVGVNITPNSTNICGMVGEFSKGPCFEIITLSNQTALEDIFGTPTSSNYKHFFSAWNYLSSASNLQTIRAVGKTSLNAGLAFKQKAAISTTPTSVTETILNSSEIPTISFGANDKIQVFAKYPGTYANTGIKVGICNYEDFDTLKITYSTEDLVNLFSVGEVVTNTTTSPNSKGTIVAIGTSWIKINNIYGTFSEDDSITNGTLVATVDSVDSYSEVISGTTFNSLYNYPLSSTDVMFVVLDGSNNVLEKFVCSLTPGAVSSDGTLVYVDTYTAESSNYIYAFNNTSQANTVATTAATLLSGGTLVAPTTGEVEEAFDLFANSNESDIFFLMLGGYNENTTVQQHVISNIAEYRKDILTFVSPTQAVVVGNSLESETVSELVNYRNNTLGTASQYAVFIGNYKYQYDSYNNVYRWIPLDGDVAALAVNCIDNISVGRFGWGYVNGQIKNIKKLAWNPGKDSRDALWKNQINSVIKDGAVSILFGNKTMTIVNDIFNVVDNRILFNYIKRGVKPFMKLFISEKNILTTQRSFKNSLDSFLNPLVGSGDIDEFKVECSDVINTPEVKAANIFKAVCAIKPSSSIRNVELTIFGLNSNVEISEVIK